MFQSRLRDFDLLFTGDITGGRSIIFVYIFFLIDQDHTNIFLCQHNSWYTVSLMAGETLSQTGLAL